MKQSEVLNYIIEFSHKYNVDKINLMIENFHRENETTEIILHLWCGNNVDVLCVSSMACRYEEDFEYNYNKLYPKMIDLMEFLNSNGVDVECV